MIAFLNQRRTTFAALLITVLLLLINWNVPYPEREWLELDYDLFPQTVRAFYLIMVGITGLAFVFEPPIRRELRESGAAPLVIGAGLVGAVLLMMVLRDDQPRRFARAVPTLSMLLVYPLMLASLAALLVVDHPIAPPHQARPALCLRTLACACGHANRAAYHQRGRVRALG